MLKTTPDELAGFLNERTKERNIAPLPMCPEEATHVCGLAEKGFASRSKSPGRS